MNEEVSRNHRQEIMFLQQMSFSADAISRNMNIPVTAVCDILEYPHDVEGRKNAHKDYNFYFHGVKGGIDALENYGMFLQEGDFEKWQPVCYMDKESEEFLKLRDEANRIPESDDPESEARRYWILMRFPKYQEAEWDKLKDKIIIHCNNIPGWLELHKNISHDKMLNFFI